MEFPQYRKYKNGYSYFKIESEWAFIELKLNGGKLESYKIEAKILPDRNYINDMLYQYDQYWDKIEVGDYEAFLVKHSDP